MLLETYLVGDPSAVAGSVLVWVKSPEAEVLRVAEINRIEGLHEVLSGLPGLAFSDYDPSVSSDEGVNGVRSEDLTRLTYPDASFDLVLTSETLEHVPDLDAALAEIRRVLVPGGRHLFTVPACRVCPGRFRECRARPNGKVEHHAVEIRHPGGDVGYPVFTEFGADLPAILKRAGFETAVHYGPVRDDDLAQVYVCRKPIRP